MGTGDKQVGANVKRIREALGLSQAEVAARMTEDGLPGWYPQTCLKVEKGTRSLRFIEAGSLAAVLGVSMSTLLDPHDSRSEAQLAIAVTSRHLAVTLREHTRARAAAEAAGEHAQRLAHELAAGERALSAAIGAFVENYPDGSQDQAQRLAHELGRAEGAIANG